MKDNIDNKNKQETNQSNQDTKNQGGIKGMFKGIICLLFGHDWVSYNEHAWICSRCMEVASKH